MKSLLVAAVLGGDERWRINLSYTKESPMHNEQIVFFQTLDIGWVVSKRVLDKIDTGNFSLRNLGEVSINPNGQSGSDSGSSADHGLV